jgi:hypothetical protein
MGKKKKAATKTPTSVTSTRGSTCDRCGAGFEVWSNYGGGNYEDDLVGHLHLFADGEPTMDPVLTYYGDLVHGVAKTTLCMRCARATAGGTR